MDIGEMFRSFFGLRGGRYRSRNDFPQVPDDHDGDESSIPTEEDDDSEFQSFFGNGRSSLDDMFHHFHGDIHRQMEALHRQMDDIMNGFGEIATENFPPPKNRPGILDAPESHNHHYDERTGRTWIFNFGQPETENKKSQNDPRDLMLKEDSKRTESLPSLPAPPSSSPQDPNTFSFSFRNPFGAFPRIPSSQDQRQDTDLDGKISSGGAMDLIKKSDAKENRLQSPPSQGFFSGNSVTMTTVRGPDGKMERKKVVRDSSGREESTVTRSVDGLSHTVTTVTGPHGVEETKQDFKNMEESDIHKFEEKWQNSQPLPPRRQRYPSVPGPSSRLESRDIDLFSKFFTEPSK